MEISAEKTKLMTSGINTQIKVNRQKLETVTCFKYLGSVITGEGSKPEILSRIAQATARLEQFGMTGVFLSVPLSHPSSCMLGNHGLSQQSCKEEYEPWKFRCHCKILRMTMLSSRKSVPRSS